MNNYLHKERFIQRMLTGILIALWSLAVHSQNHWQAVNAHDYQYDMTVYCTLYHGKNEQFLTKEELEDYEVAAFMNGECRGVGELQHHGDNFWFYVRIYSNTTSSDETITFKYYKKSDAVEKTISSTELLFVSQGQEGTASSPVKLNVDVNYMPGDATGDGTVDISDYIGVANHILGIPQTGFNADAADVNKDGVIDISDYIGVANIILTGKP